MQNAKFEYGTPVMACPLPGHDFNGFVVVNDKGEVYICNNIEFVNGAYDVNNITYTKANISEKIIDIAFEGNEGAVPYSGPYFMTETGKVLNKEGKTYEEVNKDHVARIGTVQYLVYICSDNTFDIPRTNNDYFKVVDDSGINIKGKKIFMDDSRGVETFYIIGEDNKLYNLDSTANGVVQVYPSAENKTVKDIEYNKNSQEVKVIFTDGSELKFSNIYSAYDIENKEDM